MSSARKLKQEIDKTLKKVTEGIEFFDDVWDKVYDANSSSLKDKHENELKKEIKKLQRLRDSIRNWITDKDVVDKDDLIEARKSIEKRMEMFRKLERESKTKAYSNIGLMKEEELEPEERERLKSQEWLQNSVNALEDQMEGIEFELEAEQTKKHPEQEKIADLEVLIENNKFYIDKMEQLIRLLENKAVDALEVNTIQDEIEYYIESNREPDFFPNLELFQALDIENWNPVVKDKKKKDKKKKKGKKDQSSEEEDDEEGSTEEATSSKSQGGGGDARSAKELENTSKDAATASNKPQSSGATMASILKRDKGKKGEVERMDTSGDASYSGASNVVGSGQMAVGGAQSGVGGNVGNPASAAQERKAGEAPMSVNSLPDPRQTPAGAGGTAAVAESVAAGGPPSAVATHSLKPDDLRRLEALGQSLTHLPAPDEASAASSFKPLDPVAVPPSFPSRVHPVLSKSALFERFHSDTLFFAFYHQQGTYQQYLAAKALKKHSWRFHKKYSTWFQRHDLPKLTTDDYEQGTYVYFDYETGWCQRIKREFTFEYRFLEDELDV